MTSETAFTADSLVEYLENTPVRLLHMCPRHTMIPDVMVRVCPSDMLWDAAPKWIRRILSFMTSAVQLMADVYTNRALTISEGDAILQL